MTPSWVASRVRGALARISYGIRHIDANAPELVELRALLVERVEAIDARLRELDGRNTAGATSLRRTPKAPTPKDGRSPA